jgi:hypothetical protein
MYSGPASRRPFGVSGMLRGGASGYQNISLPPDSDAPPKPAKPIGHVKASLLSDLQAVSQRPWPLIARVPLVSGALILAVAIAASNIMMSTVAREQELGVRRLAAVYLDGISTTIYPHVVARNLVNTTEALRRTMWFHQSMREQRALVRLPDGSLFADVAGPDGDTRAEDPFHNAGLDRGGAEPDLRAGGHRRRGRDDRARAGRWPNAGRAGNGAV